ncbi:MAG: tyrosine-type recombinase/integrase [Nostoc sp.]|uniref:tyrosine-type recombinase/integrase n=1 Tax=Nostoc sp. TaxID=1180 RepID=UPI002FEFAE4D
MCIWGGLGLPTATQDLPLIMIIIFIGCIFYFLEVPKCLTVAAIQKIISRAGDAANLPIKVHPHMMRHSCGYFLADQGRPTRDIQAYLGHTNIQHTVRYTAQNPKRFESFDWDW